MPEVFDGYNYTRLTAETEGCLSCNEVNMSEESLPFRYCLRSTAYPLYVQRHRLQTEKGSRSTLEYDIACVTGDPITKLAEYENIHLNPAALKEIYDEYAKLMKNACYECDLHGTKDCKYPPKWGALVRINCPFFRHQLSIEEGGLTD